MSTISSRFDTVARNLAASDDPPAEAFSARLSALYTLSQKSNYVFASPLGPVYQAGRHFHVPRFVYFGPHTHDDSLRLAFLSGFDSADLRAIAPLTDLIEELAVAPDLGQGLNLSFFPLIDVLGLARNQRGRQLARENWSHPNSPEINVLEKDARARGYHGFVRLETMPGDGPISVRLRNNNANTSTAPGIKLVSPEDFEPWAIRWETDGLDQPPGDGPLSVVDDLPINPFEVTIGLPNTWSGEQYREAIAAVLRRFILRHRALQAYRQHL